MKENKAREEGIHRETKAKSAYSKVTLSDYLNLAKLK